MPTTQITDLSVVLDEPKEVRLEKDGPVYKLPAQIPVPLMLKVQAKQEERERALAEGRDEEGEAELEKRLFDDLHAQILELFQVHQPELEAVPCTIKQLFLLIPAVYGDGIPEEERPTRPTSRTGSGKSPSSRKKSATRGTRSRSLT